MLLYLIWSYLQMWSVVWKCIPRPALHSGLTASLTCTSMRTSHLLLSQPSSDWYNFQYQIVVMISKICSNQKIFLTDFWLPKGRMGINLEVLFAFLLVLATPVWLAPAPPTPALILDSSLQDYSSASSSVRAKQEPFLIHPAADNVPKVDIKL